MASEPAPPPRRPRPRPGSVLLGLAIVAVFAAVAVNAPDRVRESDWRKRDKQAFTEWARDNGGRDDYGKGIEEVHDDYDIVCAPHYPGGDRRRGADYRIYLQVDSHGDGPPRVVRAARGPLKVKPTQEGPKCGAMPE